MLSSVLEAAQQDANFWDRCPNLVLVGLKEKLEEGKPEICVSNIIVEALGILVDQTQLQRVHRVPADQMRMKVAHPDLLSTASCVSWRKNESIEKGREWRVKDASFLFSKTCHRSGQRRGKHFRRWGKSCTGWMCGLLWHHWHKCASPVKGRGWDLTTTAKHWHFWRKRLLEPPASATRRMENATHRPVGVDHFFLLFSITRR